MRLMRGNLLLNNLLMLPMLLLLAAPPAAAQDDVQPIETDRPDTVENTSVVAPGSLQLETGLLYERLPGGRRSYTAPEALFRIGMMRRTELRLLAPPFQTLTGGRGASRRGFGDMAIGLKQALYENEKSAAALIAHAVIPTGRPFSSDRIYPALSLPWAMGLGGPWGMAAQLSYESPGSEPDLWSGVLNLSREFNTRWVGFIEYIAELQRGASGAGTIHLGTAYLPSPRSQLDLHLGFGVAGGAPDFSLGVGYSVRFDGL